MYGGDILNVQACRMCKRLFNHISGPSICSECNNKLEEKFQTVKKYLYDNPGTQFKDVAKECEVTENQLNKWIEEGRLEIGSMKGIDLKCEHCGASIITGRFCVSCKYELANGLNNSIKPTVKTEDQKKSIGLSKELKVGFHTKF